MQDARLIMLATLLACGCGDGLATDESDPLSTSSSSSPTTSTEDSDTTGGPLDATDSESTRGVGETILSESSNSDGSTTSTGEDGSDSTTGMMADECVEDRDCSAENCELPFCDVGVCSTVPDPSDECAPFEGMLAYWAPNGMMRVDPATGFVEPDAQEGLHPRTFTGSSIRHVAVDPATGHFIVDNLLRIDPTEGQAIRFSTMIRPLLGRTFHPTTGALWGVISTEGLSEIDTSTGSASQAPVPLTVGPETVQPQALAFAGTGALFAAHDGELYEVDLLTGVLSSAIVLPVDAVSLVHNPAEDVFYCAAGDAERVYRIDLETSAVDAVDIPGLPETSRLALDPVLGTLYGFDASGGLDLARTFHTIDVSTQTWSTGRRFGVVEVLGLAYHAESDRVFVSSENELYSVDREAQVFDRIGTIDPPVTRIAFGAEGALYGVHSGSFTVDGQIVSIDPVTATTTPVATIPSGDYGALAFDSGSGLLFSVDVSLGGVHGDLVTIDPTDGTFSVIGPTSIVSGLAHLEETGLLYGVNWAGDLISLDPASGTSEETPIGVAATSTQGVPITAVDGTLTSFEPGVDDGQEGRVTFDPWTGAAHIDGLPGWVHGVTYDPISEDLYIVNVLGDGATFLYDPVTNSTRTVMAGGPDVDFGDFSVDSSGTGYLLRGTDFSRYDFGSGISTPIAEIPATRPITFDDEDVLYAIGLNGNLVVVDAATGALANIGLLSMDLGELEWDGENGRLVGLEDTDNLEAARYVEIDRATAEITVISDPVPYSGGRYRLLAPRG